MMLPGVFQTSEKKCEASAAVCEANPKIPRQFVEGTAKNHRNNTELRLGWHANGPGHHVLRHALLTQHIPRMHQHGCAFIRTMVQKGDDARVVEIFLANVISDLHAQMPRAHAAREFLARRVNILQRNLAQRFQPALPFRAEFERRVVEQLRAVERMCHGALIRKQHRRSREYLHLDTVAVHLTQTNVRIPAGGIDVSEKAIADHDLGFARLGVLDPRPVGRAVASREVRPVAREEMIVDVNDWHLRFAGMNRATVFALAQALVAIKLFE